MAVELPRVCWLRSRSCSVLRFVFCSLTSRIRFSHFVLCHKQVFFRYFLWVQVWFEPDGSLFDSELLYTTSEKFVSIPFEMQEGTRIRFRWTVCIFTLSERRCVWQFLLCPLLAALSSLSFLFPPSSSGDMSIVPLSWKL